MAANPLARFCAAYHGDGYTLKTAITLLALNTPGEQLQKIAHPWKPLNDFERELKQIALQSIPLSILKHMRTPAAYRLCKKLEAALNIETQEMRNRRTREEALVDRKAWYKEN
jgi:hypothetical protein